MATDYYPQEEGAIFDAESYILPCYPDDAISEMSAVKPGTSASGRISVAVTSAIGDGIGIALRASTATGVPSRIPILFRGIAKVTFTAAATAMGEFCMNNTTTTFIAGGDLGLATFATLAIGGGASYVMGLLLQGTDASGEGLVLVGKTA